MKKKQAFLFSATSLLFFLFIFFACQKKKDTNKLESATVLPFSYSGNSLAEKVDPSGGGGGGSCGCKGHGGVAATPIEHWVATCRSECKSGLGFRCGGFYLCRDGVIIPCPWGHCPFTPEMNSNSPRMMQSDLSFYNNGGLKLLFKKPLPAEETGNIFEVEEDSEINFPDDVLVGGVHYNSFTALKGNYVINRNDGQFGSVIFNTTLNN